MNKKYDIIFKNGSKIKIIKTTESIRSKSANFFHTVDENGKFVTLDFNKNKK